MLLQDTTCWHFLLTNYAQKPSCTSCLCVTKQTCMALGPQVCCLWWRCVYGWSINEVARHSKDWRCTFSLTLISPQTDQSHWQSWIQVEKGKYTIVSLLKDHIRWVRYQVINIAWLRCPSWAKGADTVLKTFAWELTSQYIGYCNTWIWQLLNVKLHTTLLLLLLARTPHTPPGKKNKIRPYER